MKRIVIVLLIIIAAVAAALIYLNLSKPAPRAAVLLPESTLLFLDVPNFSKSRAEFQHTVVYALLQEPEVQTFLDEPRRVLASNMGSARSFLGRGGLHPMILNALQGEVFLAVTSIPNSQSGIIFGADLKGKRVEAETGLSLYERSLADDHPGMKFASTNYLGVSYTVCQLQTNQHLCHAFLNSMVVFTLAENDMRDMIARFTGQIPMDALPLASSRNYQDIVAHLPARHECVAYFNVEEVTKIIAPFLQLAPQAGTTFQKLARIKATASSIAFAGDKMQDVGFTAYNSESPVPPVNQRRTLALTTSQTSFYSTIEATDLPAAYRQIMDSIAQSGNSSLIAGAGRFEQTMTSHAVNVPNDLLASLGPETTLIATWREGTPYPEAELATEIKNAAQLRPHLDLALDALREILLGTNEPSAWNQEQYLGETLHILRPGFRGITPTYVVTDPFLIIALTPNGAREMVSQIKQPKPTLASNTDYANAMKQLPAGANSYIYCDMSAVFRPLYNRFKLAAPGADTNTFLNLAKLPPADVIARHLGPFASATVTESKSETTTTYSPLGKPLTLLITVAAGIAVAQPYLGDYLPFVNQGAATTSSSTLVHPRRRGNQTAPSQTPATP